MPGTKPGGRSKGKALIVIIGLLAVAAGVSYWALGRNKTGETGMVKARVERGTIRISVNANGTLEALRTVQVGIQIVVAGHFVTLPALLMKTDPGAAALYVNILQAHLSGGRSDSCEGVGHQGDQRAVA